MEQLQALRDALAVHQREENYGAAGQQHVAGIIKDAQSPSLWWDSWGALRLALFSESLNACHIGCCLAGSTCGPAIC